ncbi:four helix bundle protein [Sinomicrobium weinanense]|uniref:Four helix bundle protein n=1 Tax=Sinomicrobium weinanense TaxID=2842200 RepID=A0A926Q0H1_9FLAO|nr:four helix bundle protein [Sinomicrobium weinanense]MBC9794813.1 four helix bundle protein [Sinomicrobium weinanense]MBU3125072.1 four helix bundle protein [Sinomicrobium weinanense]
MTNAEFNEQMRNRTLEYAVRVLAFLETLPKNVSAKVVSYQLAKSSTSVGANFRAFCRGRSAKERYAKICIVVEEADECLYRTEFLKKSRIGNVAELNELSTEGTESVKNQIHL